MSVLVQVNNRLALLALNGAPLSVAVSLSFVDCNAPTIAYTFPTFQVRGAAAATDGGSFLKDLRKAVVDDNDDVVGDDEEVGEPADSS